MDGFNIISVEKEISKSSTNSQEPIVEIIDEEKVKEQEKKDEKNSGIFFTLSILVLSGVLAYFVFLVGYRFVLVSEALDLSEQIVASGGSINLTEIQEFQNMDRTLNSVNEKLKNHVLTASVLGFVNQNLRRNIQLSETRLEVSKDLVDVTITGTAPSSKELAEQTEKLCSLKENNELKSFSVSNLSIESSTKRVKFTLKISFDKFKVNALNI